MKKTKTTDTDSVESKTIIGYVRECMYGYGSYTLQHRAIPHFFDGLKPVQRRILTSCKQLGLLASNKSHKKSARVVGDVIGRFHPHGDTSVYGALVNMTTFMNPLIFGSGNFGTLVEGAAAMRYTECRMSDFAEKTMFGDYLNVSETQPNFDGSDREYVVLPAKLPVLFLNGAYGIATGAMCSIPAFDEKGIRLILKRLYSKKPVTSEQYLKYLVPVCPEKGVYHTDYESGLLEFINTGVGKIGWLPDYSIDFDKRTVTLTGFAPACTGNLSNALEAVSNFEFVSDVKDDSDIDENGVGNLKYIVKLKKNVEKDSDLFYTVVNRFFTVQSLCLTVVSTKVSGDNTETQFHQINVSQFFNMWVDARVDQEVRYYNHIKNNLTSKLNYAKILLTAVNNKAVILKALERDDTEQYLVDNLDISLEDAKTILELKVRQLKSLELTKIRGTIKQLKSDILEAKKVISNPFPNLYSSL
jgi:DNA gyrase/topoisomerase IV subunit A